MRRFVLLIPVLAVMAFLAACGADEPAAPTPVVDEGPVITSASELADRMLERFEANLGDLDGFMVIAGGLSATYPALPDSGFDLPQPVLTPLDTAEVDPQAPALLFTYSPNVRRMASGLRNASLSGPVEREGARVYVLSADNPAELLGTPEPAADDETTILRIYVDAATFDVREIYQGIQVDTLAQPVSVRFLYDDFREVDGVTLPFRLRQIQEGANQFIPQDMRMVQGGQIGVAQERAKREMPEGPEREARLADLERQLRAINEGIEERSVVVQEIRVTRRAASPPPEQ